MVAAGKAEGVVYTARQTLVCCIVCQRAPNGAAHAARACQPESGLLTYCPNAMPSRMLCCACSVMAPEQSGAAAAGSRRSPGVQ